MWMYTYMNIDPSCIHEKHFRLVCRMEEAVFFNIS